MIIFANNYRYRETETGGGYKSSNIMTGGVPLSTGLSTFINGTNVVDTAVTLETITETSASTMGGLTASGVGWGVGPGILIAAMAHGIFYATDNCNILNKS